MPKCKGCGAKYDIMLLAVPVFLEPESHWRKEIGKKQSPKSTFAFAQQSGKGYFRIVTSKQHWRTLNKTDKGFILAHELLHILKGWRRKSAVEERIIGRFLASARKLVAVRYPRKAGRYPIILLKVKTRRRKNESS